MSNILKPENADQVLDTISWAVSEEAPLELVGRGTKSAIGRPMQTAHTLDLSGLSGIGLYEAEELIMQAGPGTLLSEVEAALAERNQELAFEPMDIGPLLGGEASQGTIGGVFMANLAGSRRIKAGAARDHLLGFSAVTGRGELMKSGGRVVKNVTGYDLSKLICGSWGTLAAVTDLTFKVLPKAETETSLAFDGYDNLSAAKLMSRAMGSSHEVSSAAHLTGGIGAGGEAGPVTLIRVEGFGPSVASRVAALEQELGSCRKIEREASLSLWKAIRDVEPFCADQSRIIWKLSVAPMSGAPVFTAIKQKLPGVEGYFDWAGGLIWLALPGTYDVSAEIVRGAVDEAGGGHATLIRARRDVRASVPVFHLQAPALAALSNRVRESFDPKSILNPARL